MDIAHINRENRLFSGIRHALENETTKRILKIAGRAFAELSFALALNVVAMVFLATPLSMAALSTALLAALISTIAQTAWSLYKERQPENFLECERKVSHFSLINFFSLAGPGIFIHEVGHALTSLSLFRKASPSISISPLRGGSTSFVKSGGLTALGQKIGFKRSMGLVCAGGMIASTLWCVISLGLAEGLKEKSPMISEAIKIQGLMQVFNEIIEGIAVLIKYNRDFGNDFVRLSVHYGVHPIIPIALMIIVPLITFLAISCITRTKRPTSCYRQQIIP